MILSSCLVAALLPKPPWNKQVKARTNVVSDRGNVLAKTRKRLFDIFFNSDGAGVWASVVPTK